MATYPWQYSATTNDWISANPILEMRTALDQALGAPPLGYSSGLGQYEPIKATHIQELRDRVLAAWTSGSSTQINWLVSDQLGTPRMVFDETGSLLTMKRHDYLPFGEELFEDVGGRTPQQGYTTSDTVRQKFTSKERDTETGLDYFGARYYSSSHGRFTTADPLLSSGRPSNPQTWNRYSYTLSNPLKFVDPDGLFEWDASLRDNASLSQEERARREQLRNAFTNARIKAGADAAKAHNAGKLSDAKFKAINDALNAYGAENVKNGVTVGVGTGKGKFESTLPTFEINERRNGVTPTIEVKFDAGFLLGKHASIGVTHEGAHVEDSFTFANNYKDITWLTDPRDFRQYGMGFG